MDTNHTAKVSQIESRLIAEYENGFEALGIVDNDRHAMDRANVFLARLDPDRDRCPLRFVIATRYGHRQIDRTLFEC